MPVPKTACSSFKYLFFEIENGFEFRGFKANGEWKHIHNAAYPTRHYANWIKANRKLRHRITIVRDPIKRFISAYTNRVLFHRELSEEKAGSSLRKYRLPSDPDLPTFVDNLKKYIRASHMIATHVQPLVDYLGKDPSYYTRVFRFDQIGECADHIREITGTNVPLRHMQAGGPKADAEELTSGQLDKIRRFYRDDYRYFGDYF